MTALTAARYRPGQGITVEQVEAQDPQDNEVQIAVAFTGICGTDLHIVHGHMDQRHPGIIGHEMSGVVSKVGAGVKNFAEGDRVTVMPLRWCGTCPACRAGNQHVCQNLDFVGIDSPGSLQQRWNVPADIVIPLGEMDLRSGALIEPIAVAVHDVRRGQLTAGDRAVVIGGGPIGTLISAVSRAVGAEVLVLELDPTRRAAVEALGFSAIDPTATDTVRAVEEWTAGAGADVVFEVSGSAGGITTATGLAKVRGRIVIVGIHSQPRPVDLQRVFWRELEVFGARVYQRTDFDEAVQLVHDGSIPTAELITHVVSLDNITEAFTTLESGNAMKVLVDCGDAA